MTISVSSKMRLGTRLLMQLAFLNVCLSCHAQTGQAILDGLDLPEPHKQVILVTTDTWDAPVGTLQLYSRTRGGWMPAGEPVEVMTGRNGLAWGRGLHVSALPEKVEGDGRAPAGIFELGTAFGYDSTLSVKSGLPYRQTTSRDYWIDDKASADYNQWITIPMSAENDPDQRWGSFERMKRDDHLYEVGIVVRHNSDPVAPGKGSAIFIHVWRGENTPTAGCTAMSKENLVKILGWLDPQQQPLLIQAPVAGLDELKVRPR